MPSLGRRHAGLLALLASAGLPAIARAAARSAADLTVGADLVRLVTADRSAALESLTSLRQRGSADVVPGLILARRYRPDLAAELDAALRAFTGAAGPASWFDWMLWLQAEDGLVAHPDVFAVQRLVLQSIDPAFLDFLPRDVPHTIRLEEILWGGVRVDGIPALDQPAFIAAAEAGYLGDDDLVFGVAVNGDVRAYPSRILDWHEMANDVVGGVPVSLAYCTLCGAAILFEGRMPNLAEPFTFGSSGLLYRSNKLMYDRETRSLWNQFTGRPVVGPLVGSDIELAIHPIETVRWSDWRRRHPGSLVLAPATGHARDYRPGAAYGDYFASPELMFPAVLADTAHAAKDRVFVLRAPGGAGAWPLDLFADGALLNDRVGLTDVVLVGDGRNGGLRAYDRRGLTFRPTDDPERLAADGGIWQLADDALIGPDGRRLARLPGHIAYWFAAAGFLDALRPYDPAFDPAPQHWPVASGRQSTLR